MKRAKASNGSLHDKFYERIYVQFGMPDACWIWTAGKRHGYGGLDRNGKKVAAHRLSYELHNGPIPDGLLVRHTCDMPICVNPAHLLIGTAQDNVLDMTRQGQHHEQKKTHCPQNHPYAGENLYITPGKGKRMCNTCIKEKSKLRNLRNKDLRLFYD